MLHWRTISLFKSYKFGMKFKTKVICGKQMGMLDLSYIRYLLSGVDVSKHRFQTKAEFPHGKQNTFIRWSSDLISARIMPGWLWRIERHWFHLRPGEFLLA